MKFSLTRSSAALAAAGLLALAGCAGDPAPSAYDKSATPVAIVNGVTIPNEFAEVILAEQRAQGTQEDDTSMKEGVRKDLIRRSLLAQAATKAGIDKRPETLARQDLARQGALIRDYVQDWIKTNTPTDDEMKQEYETIKASLGARKEYRARHILLKTEQEAKAVIAQLNKGVKFADLARKSLDPGSKDNGGDLGWANPALFVPPFSEAMTRLAKGQYTAAPVQTDYGYHVILLEDMRDFQAPDFDAVKAELQQRMQQKKWQEYVDQLEKNADVK